MLRNSGGQFESDFGTCRDDAVWNVLSEGSSLSMLWVVSWECGYVLESDPQPIRVAVGVNVAAQKDGASEIDPVKN